MIEARAPGKLYIAGEYAVVDSGQPAVLIAVDRYLTVRVRGALIVGSVHSSEYVHGPIQWGHSAGGITVAEGGHTYVTRAIEVVHQLRSERGLACEYVDLHICSDLTDGSGRKLGLGSSAAVTVATVDALTSFYGMDLTPAQRFQLALLATIEISPEASGGDLAASTFGGWLRYTSPDRKSLRTHRRSHGVEATLTSPAWHGCTSRPLPNLESLRLLVGWTGVPASTDVLVEHHQQGHTPRYDSFIDDSRHIVADLITSLEGDQHGVIGAIWQARRLLQRLDQNGRIETPTLRQLSDIAENHEGAGKPSGAGGGDCGIAVTTPGMRQTNILRQWEAHEIMPLDLRVHPSEGNRYEF